MGILDDAIKEHLELKRRRGGDPTEIERLEREALGPVRRVAQDASPDEAVGTEDPGTPSAELPEDALHEGDDYGDEEDYEQETEYEYASGPHDDHGSEETQPEPGFVEQPEPHAGEPEPSLSEPEPPPSEPPPVETPEPHAAVPPQPPPAPAPASVSGDAPPSTHEDLGVETAEYDVEAAHAEEDEDNSILEETPEFLQDAPEHDRLWFEHRPPRDFDFDK